MKITLLGALLAVVGRCASQCPGHRIVLSSTPSASGPPAVCHVSEDCMSATCHMGTDAHPSAAADSVTLKLDPCSIPIQMTISGSLQDGGIGVLPEIRVGGVAQVPINLAGLLQVTQWTVTESTLHFGIEVSSGAVPPLFNATLTYDRTQYCTSGEADGAEGGVSETVGSLSGSNREDSSSQEIKDSGKETDTVAAIPTSSSFTSPLPSTTMCEVLQRIAGSRNTQCQVPNTCQTLECTTEDDNYRIGVTILPCGEIPSVMIAVYHLPEESTLLHKVYTGSSREPVYLGESRLLFNMVVSIKQSMAHITLMLELTFPGDNSRQVVFPATDVPVDRSSCPVSYANLGDTTLQQRTLPQPTATTSKRADILSHLPDQPKDQPEDARVPEGFKIVLGSVVVTAVLLVAVAVVVTISIIIHRKLDKYYAKLDKRLII